MKKMYCKKEVLILMKLKTIGLACRLPKGLDRVYFTSIWPN